MPKWNDYHGMIYFGAFSTFFTWLLIISIPAGPLAITWDSAMLVLSLICFFWCRRDYIKSGGGRDD